MGHKYVKEDETFDTSRNGTVPKPTAGDISNNKVLRADGSWVQQSGGGSSHTYSTTEQVVGTWIDGKPLYEKTISKSYNELSTYGSRKGFELDVADADVRYIEAVARSASYGRCFLGCRNYTSAASNSPYWEVNMYYSIVVIEAFNGKTLSDISPSLTVTFQYTKTTD